MSNDLTQPSASPPERTSPGSRPLHLALLVLKISALGAVAGAIAAVLALSVWALIFQSLNVLGATPVAAYLGAILGAVLFPLAGFTLLREVPLWKILVTTIIGTSIGGIVGISMITGTFLMAPIGGFALSVLWLVIGVRRARRRAIAGG